ncbi:hypothetical protein ACQEVF_45235 [Nonomuraea polychroma]
MDEVMLAAVAVGGGRQGGGGVEWIGYFGFPSCYLWKVTTVA